jgi:peptidoglycan-associated lipoprotein
MTIFMRIAFVTLLALSMVISGCSKKVTKVEPTPEPTPPPQVQQPAPAPTPAPPVEEPKEDISGELQKILVPIYFDFDRSELRAEGISSLETIAKFLKDHASVRLMAEGNADERGSSEYNMGLGENRAKSVKNYLTSYGIAGDKIETTSYGRERPAKPNCGEDDACHALNRRVEWQILAK